MLFRCVAEDIYKLDFTCGDGYTSVFAFHNSGRWILADSGSTVADADNCIIPAVKALCFVPECLICSHLHDDHYGGFRRLCEVFPFAQTASYGAEEVPGVKNRYRLTDGELYLDRYRIVALGGHTDESVGIYDIKNNILVSFDGLQLFGIGAYGTNIKDFAAYIKTLEKVSAMNLDGIVASHAYEPYGAEAFGKKRVENYLNGCRDAVKLIVDIIYNIIDIEHLQDYPAELIAEAAKEAAKAYRSEHKNLPVISEWTFQNAITGLLSPERDGKVWISNK